MTLQQAVFAGLVDPGKLVIVREIQPVAPPAADCTATGTIATTSVNCDIAVFRGPQADFTVVRNANGSFTVTDTTPTPDDDGVDTLTGMEVARFDDGFQSLVVNSPATATVADTTPQETVPLSVAIADANGVPATVGIQWQQSALGGAAPFTNITGATSASFTPAQAQVNRALQVVVTFTDNAGNAESVTTTPTGVTGDLFVGTALANTFTGTAGDDVASGLGGNDVLNGNGGDDVLIGGPGDDTVNGGAGRTLPRVGRGRVRQRHRRDRDGHHRGARYGHHGRPDRDHDGGIDHRDRCVHPRQWRRQHAEFQHDHVHGCRRHRRWRGR